MRANYNNFVVSLGKLYSNCSLTKGFPLKFSYSLAPKPTYFVVHIFAPLPTFLEQLPIKIISYRTLDTNMGKKNENMFQACQRHTHQAKTSKVIG